MELFEYVTPHHASKWKSIGICLGLPCGKLENIEAGWPKNVEWCCDRMLELWLGTDTKASWKKINKAIQRSVARASNTQTPDFLHKGIII